MEDRKKKIIILTSIIVVILIIAILLVIKLTILKNSDKTIPVNSNQKINNTIQTENIIENNETENEINNTVNEIVSEENEDEAMEENQPTVEPEQEVDKEIIEKIESDEEKAIRIAQENWFQGENVSFTHEDIIDGKHIVYVRNKETHHIATFKINIENETFEILQ